MRGHRGIRTLGSYYCQSLAQGRCHGEATTDGLPAVVEACLWTPPGRGAGIREGAFGLQQSLSQSEHLIHHLRAVWGNGVGRVGNRQKLAQAPPP